MHVFLKNQSKNFLLDKKGAFTHYVLLSIFCLLLASKGFELLVITLLPHFCKFSSPCLMPVPNH